MRKYHKLHSVKRTVVLNLNLSHRTPNTTDTIGSEIDLLHYNGKQNRKLRGITPQINLF